MFFRRRKETIAIEERLRQGNIGDQITVSEMEAICGVDCDGSQTLGYRCFRSARNSVMRKEGLIWDWDRSTRTYRCLTDSQKVVDSTKRLQGLHRRAKTVDKQLKTVNLLELTAQEQIQCAANQVQSQLISRASSKYANKHLQKYGAEQGLVTPNPNDVLQLCKARNKQLP